MKDPYQILGVSPDADDDAIHSAYLAQLQECPPERDPRRFQAVRRAYETVRTRRLRLQYEMFHAEPPTPEDILCIGLVSATPRRPTPTLFRRALAAGLTGRAAAGRGRDR